MGTGAHLASQAENQLFAHEIEAEEHQYRTTPRSSGLRVLLVGGGSAAIGDLIGVLVPEFL
jgi:hypothetical protein